MTNKHKVVLVPTEDKTAPIGQFKDGLKLSTMNCIIPFHIHIISDEEIKQGDWFLDWNNKQDSGIQKCTKRHLESFKDSGILCKKIVSSSDASLGLPLVPDTFEKYYVDQHNLGNVITEVDVEYETTTDTKAYNTLLHDDYYKKFPEELPNCIIINKPKVNSDNTINIIVPSVSDSLEEVSEILFKKYSNLCQFEEGEPEYLLDKEDFKAAIIEYQKTSCNTYSEDEVFKILNTFNKSTLKLQEYKLGNSYNVKDWWEDYKLKQTK